MPTKSEREGALEAFKEALEVEAYSAAPLNPYSGADYINPREPWAYVSDVIRIATAALEAAERRGANLALEAAARVAHNVGQGYIANAHPDASDSLLQVTEIACNQTAKRIRALDVDALLAPAPRGNEDGRSEG